MNPEAAYALYPSRREDLLKRISDRLDAQGWEIEYKNYSQEPDDSEDKQPQWMRVRSPSNGNHWLSLCMKHGLVTPDEVEIEYPTVLCIYISRAALRPENPSLDDYLTGIAEIVDETSPAYVCGCFTRPPSADKLPSVEELRNGRIPEMFWLNVFSEPTIERIGRERLHSAPAWRVEDIGDDHIMVITRDGMSSYSEKWRDYTSLVKTYLSDADTEESWVVWDGDSRMEPVAKWLIPPG